MTEHFSDRAPFIATLPVDDRERRLAEQHAQSCEACRDALRDGAELAAMVRQVLPPAVVSPNDTGATRTAAIGTDRDATRRVVWAAVGALVLAWVFQLMVGGGFDVDLDCLVESLAVLGIAIASVLLVRWNKNWAPIAVATVIGTSGVFAYMSGTNAGLELGTGIRCTFRELWAAGIAWTIILTLGRRAGVTFGRWSATAIAAAAALAAHAGQHLACKVPHSDAHLLLFHFGGLLLATMLGGVAAKRGLLVSAEG